MGTTIKIVTLTAALFTAAAQGQTSGKGEFEVASIKTNEPQTGFHFPADSASGGPGTPDPGMFRCSKCSLATLIVKAFNLQPYQFPGRTAINQNTFDVVAKIPAGATAEEFSAMLQNLLKERFGLTSHFDEKKMKGYHLVVGKNGSKLKESIGEAAPAGQHGGESHSHSGVMAFGPSASFRASNQTTADLVRVLCDQLGVPVDDETGLTGRYDITLRWSGGSAEPHAHTEGASHDGGRGAPAADPSGPTLFDALQQQLGLKLVPAEQAVARLFVIDRVLHRPTEN